ncbi:skip-1 [Lambdina fiscellaria nucleopolyhedrovirus]|uniref:Skip-1 n=1 Tax=Lambdina fiscellaria nucleopolyhedrovirus TaxID=1642929 RepID=A0A0E3Z7D0_9ABAC|nr:skip-1 [Lambdina fiscellaria nucleopolyhedrovirus]AKC91652.1 skip-1 [Lambdina fiscellaria nucleopolyhedrovirus]
MEEKVLRIRIKANNLRKQYENKIIILLKNNTSKSAGFVNDVKHLEAILFGYEEQLYALDCHSTHSTRVDFVNNLCELGLSNAFIERLLAAAAVDLAESVKLLINQYNGKRLNECLQKVFNLNARAFVRNLIQFVAKRKAYRKQNKKINEALLEELVLLKALIIKHLSVLIKLTIVCNDNSE